MSFDRKKAMRYSIKEGTAAEAKQGIVGNFLIPFALALGANNQMIGLINALPSLANILGDMIAPYAIKLFGNRKKTTMLSFLFNRLIWILIGLVPFIFNGSLEIFLIFLCIRAFINGIGIVSWTSWMTDLIPIKNRGKFFGKRNMIAYSASLITTALAGAFLGFLNGFEGFLIIFIWAAFFGALSVFFQSKIPEPKMERHHTNFHFNISKFFDGIFKGKFYSNFVIFSLLINFAVMIASPFMVVYILEDIGIGYFWYGIAMAVYFLANIVFQPYWGKISDQYGDCAVLKITALLLAVVPLAYIFMSNLYHVLIIEAISGFIWAGFNLSMFNYSLDCIPKYEKSTFLANYNILTNIGYIIGPLVGGFIATALEATPSFAYNPLHALFFISMILRFSISALMISRLGEMRVENNHMAPFKKIFVNSVFFYPARYINHERLYLLHAVRKMERKVSSR